MGFMNEAGIHDNGVPAWHEMKNEKRHGVRGQGGQKNSFCCVLFIYFARKKRQQWIGSFFFLFFFRKQWHSSGFIGGH